MARIIKWSVKGKVSKDFFEIGDTKALSALRGDADSMLVRSHDDPFRLMVLIGPSNEQGILLFEARIEEPYIETTSNVVGFPVQGSQIVEIQEMGADPEDASFSADLIVQQIIFIADGVWPSRSERISLRALRDLGDLGRLFFELDELQPGLNDRPSGRLYLLDSPLPDTAFIETSSGE